MFYSNDLLRFRRGNLWVVWLLGNNSGTKKPFFKLRRYDILHTKVSEVCKQILDVLPCQAQHISLPLAATLALGTADCHMQQVEKLLFDIRKSTKPRLLKSGGVELNIDLQKNHICQDMDDPVENARFASGFEGHMHLSDDHGSPVVAREADITMREPEAESRILEEDFGFSDTRVGEEGPGLFDDDELALGFQATTVEPLEQMEEPLNGTNILAVTAEDRPVPLAPKRSHEERQRHDETELEGDEASGERPKKRHILDTGVPVFPDVEDEDLEKTSHEAESSEDVEMVLPDLDPEAATKKPKQPPRGKKKMKKLQVEISRTELTTQEIQRNLASGDATTDLRQYRVNTGKSQSRDEWLKVSSHSLLSSVTKVNFAVKAVCNRTALIDEAGEDLERDVQRKPSILDVKHGISLQVSSHNQTMEDEYAIPVHDPTGLLPVEDVLCLPEDSVTMQSQQPEIPGQEQASVRSGSLVSSDILEDDAFLSKVDGLALGGDDVAFDDIVRNMKSKRAVAIAFRQLLQLEAAGRLYLHQREFNGPIIITCQAWLSG